MQVQERNVEIRTTKEGIQYRLIYDDVEVSGFTTSRSKSVVEKIVERMLHAANEAPPEVSIAADRLADYVVSTVSQFNVDHVSAVEYREVFAYVESRDYEGE